MKLSYVDDGSVFQVDVEDLVLGTLEHRWVIVLVGQDQLEGACQVLLPFPAVVGHVASDGKRYWRRGFPVQQTGGHQTSRIHQTHLRSWLWSHGKQTRNEWRVPRDRQMALEHSWGHTRYQAGGSIEAGHQGRCNQPCGCDSWDPAALKMLPDSRKSGLRPPCPICPSDRNTIPGTWSSPRNQIHGRPWNQIHIVTCSIRAGTIVVQSPVDGGTSPDAATGPWESLITGTIVYRRLLLWLFFIKPAHMLSEKKESWPYLRHGDAHQTRMCNFLRPPPVESTASLISYHRRLWKWVLMSHVPHLHAFNFRVKWIRKKYADWFKLWRLR